jgi:hypothetical protein
VAVCRQGANYDEASGAGAHILLFKALPVPPEPDGPGAARKEAGPDPTPVTPASMPPLGRLTRRRTKRLGKQDFSGPGHAEPDGDETPPLDYATRGQQYELWSCLWDKWERFCGTYYDIVGDCDDDNVPYLPILVASIGQFQSDVVALLDELGLVAKTAPALEALTDLASEIAKAGAPMAGHRLTRLKAAIEQLQQILEECTPAPIDRPGVSAADVLGMPYVMKGGAVALTKTAESDKAHCEQCDGKDCDNPAHDRMKKELQMAETLEGVTKRALLAEAEAQTLAQRVAALEPQLAEAQSALTKTQGELAALQAELAISKMSPDEQREALLASMPELVRKSYLDQETRLGLIEKANRDLQEKNERLDYIQKAALFRPLGFVPDDHWEILKAIDAMPEQVRTELLRLLQSQAELAKGSPWLTTVGANGIAPAGATSGTAEAQILALAEAYQKEHGVGLGDAVIAIGKSHPDLWAQDQREKRFRNRVESR